MASVLAKRQDAYLPILVLDESVHTLHGKGLHGPQGWSGAHGYPSDI